MTARHVALRADGTPQMGVGHVVRCLALAEELLDRGARVTLVGTVTVPWVLEQLAGMDITVVAAPDGVSGLVELVSCLGCDAVVLDGYELDPGTGAALRTAGLVVLALHDGAFGAAQDADVYLDQNHGALPHPRGTQGRTTLTGLDHALFRRSVLDLARRPRESHTPPRVLALFGGTDPCGGVVTLAPLVLATGVPLDLTCVVVRPELAAELERLEPGPGQRLRLVAPSPEVPTLAADSTVTVSAAGSSVWELFHLGVPTAVVAVADNQELAYAEVTGLGVADPGGHLDELRGSPAARAAATATITRLLEDPAHRDALSTAARRLVDGMGRRRVADALLAAVSDRASR